MKMLKMLSVEEVSEYVLNSEVFVESGVYKVKLNDDCEVISKEERLVEMVSNCEESVNEDFMDLVEEEVEENCDLYKVKGGEYKDWYVLMCYDYGDSLCEIEVSKNRDDLVG